MIKKECTQCGKEFILSDSEIEFYKSRELSIPKRCKECRSLNKNKTHGDSAVEIPYRKQYPPNSKGPRKGFHLIFILLLLCVVGLVTWELNRQNDRPKQYIEQSIENNSKELDQSNSKELDQDNNETLEPDTKLYSFRTEEYGAEHFEKHGNEFDYASIEEYVEGANRVINSSESLHKLEKEMEMTFIIWKKQMNSLFFLRMDI